MSYKEKCPECGGEFLMLGTDGRDSGIDVECKSCGEGYTVEPDGLGEGGLEMVDAMMIDMGLVSI